MDEPAVILQRVEDDTHDQLIDGLNALIYAARHRTEADVLIARKALMSVFADHLHTALADTRRVDDLSVIAGRKGVIITAGDNSFSVTTGSIRTAMDSFIEETAAMAATPREESDEQ